MNVLQQDEGLYLLIESQVGSMVEISQSIFFGFCLIYLVYLAYFKADKEEFDLGAALIGIAVLSLLIITYKWWTDEIGVYFVNIAKEIDRGQGSEIYKLIGSALDKIEENRRLRLSRVSGALSLLAGDFTLLEYTQWLFLSGGLLIVKAGTIVFEGLQFILQIGARVGGAFAIAFTLLPFLRESLLTWFMAFCTFNYWSVVYAQISVLFNAIIKAEFNQMLTAQASFTLDLETLISIFVWSVLYFVVVVFLIPVLSALIIIKTPSFGLSSIVLGSLVGAKLKLVNPIVNKLKAGNVPIGNLFKK